MSSLISLKTRLSSVGTTQKVIKAMELVASSKIKKSKIKALSVKHFQDTLKNSIEVMSGYSQYEKLLKKNAAGYDLYVVITSDMGLCGPYNMNVTKKFIEEVEGKENFKALVLGGKGYKKLTYANYEILESITNYGNRDELELAKELSQMILKKWNQHLIKDIKVIYTDYINPITQEVKILDVFRESLFEKKSVKREIDIEPSAEEVFPKLFEQYLFGLLYSTILKSLASEHSYRRNSMDAANKNSLELIDKLGLEINRKRQSMITQEITEIIAGSESSKKE